MKKFIAFMNVLMKFYSIYYMVIAVLMIFGVYELSKTNVILSLFYLSVMFWKVNIELIEK